MRIELDPARQKLIDRVAELTREKIAPRAAEHDRHGRNPVESWRDLWREGFLAGTVPLAHGGLGLDMPTYAGVIRTVAQGCASTAMTLHMHSTVMRFIDALGTEEQKRRYFPEVVERGRLFGSWGSEPAVSLSRTLQMETVARAGADGAFVVEGVKHFCTMTNGASHYMTWCALDGSSDMSRSLVLILVPADAAGLATDERWDTMGMRATFSPSVTFTAVRCAPGTCLGAPGAALRAGVIEGFALGYAAVYLGIAEGALAFVLDYAKQRVVRPENIAVAQDPVVQTHIGDLQVRLDAAALVLADSAARWAEADVPQRGVLANRAKWVAAEAGLYVTSKAMQVVGGRATYRELPVERAFRDLRTATLMPPTPDRMLQGIGQMALGIQGGMFKVAGETPPSR